MKTIADLIGFLDKLDDNKIHYELKKVRDSIMVIASVPGERWEIEFMSSGDVEIEKFKSTGETYEHSEIKVLFERFAN